MLSPRTVLGSFIAIFSISSACCTAQAVAQNDSADTSGGPFAAREVAQRAMQDGSDYSPYTGAAIPQQLLWGDTHLHSSQSIDANSAGNEKLSPAEAYKFARGEQVVANNGQAVRLSRPLDFLVVSDHAEYLGLLPKLKAGDPSLQRTPFGRDLLATMAKGNEAIRTLFTDLSMAFIDSDNRYPAQDISFDTWKDSSKVADHFNQPGRFTALIGYEWTYFPNGDNLHRVVVYKDGADKAASMPAYSALDGNTPEQLWAFMEEYEQKTGGEVIAIPHNSNVSNGRMFALQDSQGKPLTSSYNQLRQRWEPIAEVTQIKGDSEAHPYLSPQDEFADFETWDKGNLNVVKSQLKTNDMLQFEYARSALKLGLAQETATGQNPFKFGMIGSTDAHTSLATAAENNFWGKASMIEPGFERMAGTFMPATPGEPNPVMAWEQVASGYAAVWATENTREAIFAAMKRKEVYATTGSRISLRFFGGWFYQQSDLQRPDRFRHAYTLGVPMGGDLIASKSSEKSEPRTSRAPRFLVAAAKDPIGANLDRIQIVKGWEDTEGRLHEKVYNVAVSPERTIKSNGQVTAVKSTVNFDTLSYDNTAGSAQLETVWIDPEFDVKQRAFYYARVLEIPTPRWSEFDQKKFGYDVPKDAPREIQDRAYSSPVWYTPAN